MQKIWLAFLWLMLALLPVRAERILADLDFSQGDWTLVGVPMHNYRMLPVQSDLGTFICKDLDLLRRLQRDWDLGLTFDDKCDYHYSLKFYQNGELRETLDLNLYCGYITFQGLSYVLQPDEFERIRMAARRVPWSRITFKDLEVLKSAIQTLAKADDVYWYEDVRQYEYPGFFMLSVNNVPWSTDRDSLLQVVQAKLEREVGTDDFYLQEYFHVIRDERMFVRYLVNSEPDLASGLDNIYMGWRSHLYDRDSVSVLAIGIDEQRYRRLMRGRR